MTTRSRLERPTKTEVKKTIARFGGATVLAMVVGLGAGVGSAVTTAAMTPSSPVAPAATPAAAVGTSGVVGPTSNGAVSGATLTGCVGGLNC